MSDNKKYYYMRLKENYFESNEQLYLESLPDGYAYSNILLKLYLRSLNRDGLLMFNDRTPYNAQMIAHMTRHPIKTVQKALALFQELGIIEMQESGAIFMLDVQSFVGKTSTESERIREYRMRVKRSKAREDNVAEEAANDVADDVTDDVTNVRETSCKCTPETEKETDTEKEIKIKTETERERETDARATPSAAGGSILERISSAWNSGGLEPVAEVLTEQTRKALCTLLCRYGVDAVLQAVDKVRQSSFLRNGSERGWKATFDWFVQEENFLKVRSGVYDAFR